MREQRDQWMIEQGHDPSSIQRVRRKLTARVYAFLWFFAPGADSSWIRGYSGRYRKYRLLPRVKGSTLYNW